MKAQHRHELHTNLLADRMGRLLKGMKSTRKSTSVLIWVFVVLAVGTYALWQYYTVSAYTERSLQWSLLDGATRNFAEGRQELAKLADEHPGSVAARTARFILARMALQEGQASLMNPDPSSRLNAAKAMREAVEAYEKLASESGDFPVLEQECLQSIAAGEEALSHVSDPSHPDSPFGSLEKALEAYRKLAAKYPDTEFGKEAARRAQLLETPPGRDEVAKFYAELSQSAKPLPALDSKGPPPGALPPANP